jgi:hypothetical protein
MLCIHSSSGGDESREVRIRRQNQRHELLEQLLGVHRRAGAGYVVGSNGTVYGLDTTVDTPRFTAVSLPFVVASGLHACSVDEAGCVWAVGGRLTGVPLTGGVLVRFVP